MPDDTPGTEVEPLDLSGLAIPDGGFDPSLMVGMDAFDATDMVTPRISIIQSEAVFEDGLTKEKMDQLEVVVLGFLKQRVLWEAEIPEGTKARPLCKSTNFEEGYPNMKTFPWDESGFDPNNYDDGQAVLPCANCALKEWGSHPGRSKSDAPPWCTAQYLLVVLRRMEGDMYAPAMLSLQRSAMASTKAYLNAWATRKVPPMTVHTILSLEAKKRGQTHYATPVFEIGEPTEPAMYPSYAEQFRGLRTFLTAPPNLSDDDGDTPEQAAAKQEKRQAAQPTVPAGRDEPDEAEPVPATVGGGTTEVVDGDDDPF